MDSASLDGAVGQSTGTLFEHEPTAENPHVYRVENPTAADIAAAANKNDHPRYFYGSGNMSAWLVYHTRYRPQSNYSIVYAQLDHSAFIGNRNQKYRNPRYAFTQNDDGFDAFCQWWCQLPATVAERKYLFGQLRDVRGALSLNDVPLAIALLGDINLADADGRPLASHVKAGLIKALEASMFPEMWDYMDPDTRPYIPFAPKVPTNSLTISSTIVGSGTSITISTA